MTLIQTDNDAEKGVGAVVWGLAENQNQQSVRGQVLRGGVCVGTGPDSWGIIQSVCVCGWGWGAAIAPCTRPLRPCVCVFNINSEDKFKQQWSTLPPLYTIMSYHYHHYIQSCLIITTNIYNHVLSLAPIYTIMSYHQQQYIQSCLIITTNIYNHVLSLPPIYTIMSYHQQQYIQSCLIISNNIYNHVLSLATIYTIMSHHQQHMRVT